MNKRLRGVLIFILWLVIWQAITCIVDNKILLTGPVETFMSLLKNSVSLNFWQTIMCSMLRISTGFIMGVLIGIAMGVMAYRFRLVDEFFSPFLVFLKSVPVASFVVLFLIWWHSDKLSVAISLIIVLPQMYIGTLEGLKSTDKELLEMAKVLGIHPLNSFFYIYRPAVRPFLDASAKIAVGMAWKSGVAAEVIGTPDYSIGGSLYMSKIYLDTAGVLSWTIVVILLSVICEKIYMRLRQIIYSYNPACRRNNKKAVDGDSRQLIKISGISKSFGDKQVLKDYSLDLSEGEIEKLSWVSGAGKTTLLRIIAGLELADTGKVIVEKDSVAMLFQEDRLCMDYDAITNVSMVCGDSEYARKELSEVLDKQDLGRPVRELSGGQKRRVAIVRTLVCAKVMGKKIILLDEPYNGLDVEAKKKVERYIFDNKKEKAFILSAH